MRRAPLLAALRRASTTSAAPSQPTHSCNVVCIGVGSAGTSIVNSLARLSLPGDSRSTRVLLSVVDDARTLSEHESIRSIVLRESAEERESERIARDALASGMGGAVGGGGVLQLAPDVDLAVVVTDLGEAVGVGGAPVLCEELRARGCLTLSLAVYPLPFGGPVRLGKAKEGLLQLRKSSDATILVDTATLSGTMSGAHFLAAHSLFSDMVASNLHSLLLPLLRTSDLKKITLSQYRSVFRRNELGTRGRLARLVCAQSTLSDDNSGQRGATVLQRALTDAVFPINDLGKSSGLLMSLDSSKDLSFSELEQVMEVNSYIPANTLVVDGLSFSSDVPDGAVKLTLAVVDGDDAGLSETEQREDEIAKADATRAPVAETKPLMERAKEIVMKFW